MSCSRRKQEAKRLKQCLPVYSCIFTALLLSKSCQGFYADVASSISTQHCIAAFSHHPSNPKTRSYRKSDRSHTASHRDPVPTVDNRQSILTLNASKRNSDKLNENLDQEQINTAALTLGLCFSTIFASLVVLWSEYAVILTGCGPLELSDKLERLMYLIVLAAASIFWLTRIVTTLDIMQESQGLARVLFPEERMQQRKVMEITELFSFIAVAGAFVALGAQAIQGNRMDGLSGIDINMCKSVQLLDRISRNAY